MSVLERRKGHVSSYHCKCPTVAWWSVLFVLWGKMLAGENGGGKKRDGIQRRWKNVLRLWNVHTLGPSGAVSWSFAGLVLRPYGSCGGESG